MASITRPWITRYLDAQEKRVPAGTPGAHKVRSRARKWYAQGLPGSKKRVPLSANKSVALQMLGKLVERAELAKVGIIDHAAEHRGRPIERHLADFEGELATGRTGKRRKAPSVKHRARVMQQIRAVVAGCGIKTAEEITLPVVQAFIHELTVERSLVELPTGKEWFTAGELAEVLELASNTVRARVRRGGLAREGRDGGRRYPRTTAEALRLQQLRGLGSCTAGFYARHIKAFARWLVRRKRLADDPLADLEGASDESDHRHDRRALTDAEATAVLAAALASTATVEGWSGRDRWAIYLTAISTGFRAEELSMLQPEWFELVGQPPTVTLPGDRTKNGVTAVQPLPPHALFLVNYLADRPHGKPIWGGDWCQQGAAMLRVDLAAAGVPYVIEGPEGPLYADFHALRHTYIAMLDRAGVSLKQAMQLARVSDPKLVLKRYGRAQLADLGASAAKLPDLTGKAAPLPARRQGG